MALSFDEFKRMREESPELVQSPGVGSKRLPGMQGMAQEPQQPRPSNENTGVGAMMGSAVGTGMVMLPAFPKHPLAIETVIGATTAAGDLGESFIRRGKITKEDLKHAGEEAGVSMGMGLGTTAAMKGFSKTAQYFKESVTPEAREAITFLKRFYPEEQFMTSSEMTENRLLDIVGNFSEHSLWGGGDIRKFKLHRDDVLGQIKNDMVDMIASHKDQINLGKMVLNIRNQGNKLAKVPASNIYKNIELNAGHLRQDITNLKAFAEPFAEQNAAIGRFGQDLTGYGLAEKILKFKDDMSVRDLMAFQRAIRAKVRSLESAIETKNAPAIKWLGDLHGEVDKLVEKGLTQPGAPVDLFGLKRQADAMWKQTKETFSNDLINDLVKKLSDTPSGISKYLLTAEHQGAEELYRAVNAVLPEHAKQSVRRGVVEQMYKNATDVESGVLSGRGLLKMLEGKNGMGMRAAKELFGAEGADNLLRFAKSISKIHEKTPIGEGKLAIQFTQFGALLAAPRAITKGQLTAEVATLLIGPKALAKIITSPRATEWLLKGASMPASSPEWPKLAARITGLFTKAEMDEQRQEQSTTLKDIIGGEPALSTQTMFQ